MIKNYSKNQSGTSLVELMVAAVIAVIVLGGSIYVFTTQQSILKDQNDSTKVRAKGRLAIKLLAREIRMAGFGIPPGLGLTNISTANSISYRSNLDEKASTFLDSSGTGITPSDPKVLAVTGGNFFATDDEIIIYNPAYNDSDFVTVTSASSNSIGFSGTLNNSYNFGDNAMVVYVNKYKEITIALTGNRITKQWGDDGDMGQVVTIINDIAASGLEFKYYNFIGVETTSLSDIQKIGITLNMLDPDNADAVIQFQTDVDIRNATPQT